MHKKFELFVTILAALSVVVILLQYVFVLSANQLLAIYIFDLVVVIILAFDFYIRMKASKESYSKFVLKHWYEIPAMIPLLAFALVENQTIIGAASRSLRLIRLFRIIHLFFRTMRILEGTRFLYLVMFSAMAITFGAIGEYIIESSVQGAKITNLGDAFWWAIVTVTTVGYGDVYPVTVEGRIIASILMVVGIAILGVFISTLGAALIESRLKKRPQATLVDETKLLIKNKIDSLENLNQKDFDTLMDMIRSLRDMLNNNNKR